MTAFAESFAHRDSVSEVDLESPISNMMPLFRGSEEFRCFFPFFLRLQRSGPRNSGKCEVRNNNIIQRNSEIKEATVFMKLIYNFVSAKQLLLVLVLPITLLLFCLFFLRVFNKVQLRNNNSEMVPAKSENREKVGKFVVGREVGQGKIKYLQISCCRVHNQPENIIHQNVLTS